MPRQSHCSVYRRDALHLTLKPGVKSQIGPHARVDHRGHNLYFGRASAVGRIFVSARHARIIRTIKGLMQIDLAKVLKLQHIVPVVSTI